MCANIITEIVINVKQTNMTATGARLRVCALHAEMKAIGNGAVWKGELLMNDTLKAALNLYGPEAQTLMVFEEMSELQKELCKHARGADNRAHIAEDIADVLIMLDQMMILHDCESLVTRFRELKIERLEQRIREMEGRKEL